MEGGDCGICNGQPGCGVGELGGWKRTGVRSRSESASLAEVAASIRSSQRLPITVAALWGSAEKALRPSILILRA